MHVPKASLDMTKRVSFKQADLTRALLGVRATGLTIMSVSISPDGAFSINVAGRDELTDAPNPLDRLHNRNIR